MYIYWFIVIFNIALLGNCLLLIIVLAPVFITMVVYLSSNNTLIVKKFKDNKYKFILIILTSQLFLFLLLIAFGIINPAALDYLTYFRIFPKYIVIRTSPYSAILQIVAFISILLFMLSTFFRICFGVKKDKVIKLAVIGVLIITWILIRSVAAIVMIYTLTGVTFIPNVLLAPLLRPSIILAIYILTAVVPVQAGILFRKVAKNKKVNKTGTLLIVLGLLLATLVGLTLFMGGMPIDPRLAELINICNFLNRECFLEGFKINQRHVLGFLEFLRVFDKYDIIEIFPRIQDAEIIRLWVEMGIKYSEIWIWVWFSTIISMFGTFYEHLIVYILFKFTIIFTAVIFSLLIIKKFNLIETIQDLLRNIF